MFRFEDPKYLYLLVLVVVLALSASHLPQPEEAATQVWRPRAGGQLMPDGVALAPWREVLAA